MTLRAAILLTFTAALAGCGGTTTRYAVPSPLAEEAAPRIASKYGSLEIREISLPTYASSEEIATRDADGAIVSEKTLLWADEPSRAITLELSRLLGQMTRAQVAAEPWPFLDRAAAQVDVRVEEMLADEIGGFQLSGQYYVAPDSGIGGRSGLFSITVPIVGEGARVIAAARGVAVRQLAEQIAREGLR
ncbi:PqiC family protein [Pseudooceanicola sp.]|uniref:PqiC family protein n=1 Tax=Pseudooceanicola sp. TaxID=1914328 RepID=UPI0040586B14